MQFFKLLKSVTLVMLLLSPFALQADDKEAQCEATYDACQAKCDKSENPSENCYELCNDAFDQCIAVISEEK